MNNNNVKKNNFTGYLLLTVLLIIITTAVGIMVFSFYINHFTTKLDARQYDHYYVMIAGDTNTSFWQSVYEGAYAAGLEENSYVDFLNGSFDNSYSREDLMRIATASEVDGIIVAADESEEMTTLINEATAQGIPVVTLNGDNTQSDRCTFVGIGSYDLGREYGRQVLEIIREKDSPVKVMVLVNTYALDSGQNILYSGIQETIEQEKQGGEGIELPPASMSVSTDDGNAAVSIEEAVRDIELSLVSIDDSSAFAAEEAIRDIFMEEELPDIIICLNELNTTCVYQAVVDYNKVGQVDILGYYDSDTIINAIDRNVIYATISVDTMQMGEYCVEALTEYNTFGNTSQYFIADIELINKENVGQYLQDDTAQE